MIHYSMGKYIARKYGAVVMSPDYTLSLKAPYPAAFKDGCAALEYMFDHAEELNIDPNKIIVGGESAGGGLAASVCLYNRDHRKIPVILQLPMYPMLDSEDTESSRDNHGHGWNTRKNHIAWARYLGQLYKTDKVPSYASISRTEDYYGLPPCYTYVEDGEPFYTETLAYVRRLNECGVKARVDVFHGNTHSFDALFWTDNANKARQNLLDFVKDYLD